MYGKNAIASVGFIAENVLNLQISYAQELDVSRTGYLVTDGVMGFNLAGYAGKAPDCMLGALMNQKYISQPMLGIYLSSTSGDNNSEIVFGSFDEKMVRFEDILWNNTLITNTWSVGVSKFQIGSTPIVGSYNGIISGRPYIGLPQNSILYLTFEQVLLKTQQCQINLDPYGAFVCESSQPLTNLPNITMNVAVGNLTISIPPSSYIYDMGNGVYKMAVIPVYGDDVILGTPFMSRVYTVLDYGSMEIGMVRIEDMQTAKSKIAFIVTFSVIGGVTLIVIIVLAIYCIKHRKKDTSTTTAEESFEVDTKN